MANTKYKYNPNTLSYEEVELTIKDKLLRVSYYAIVGVVLSVIIMAFMYRTIQRSDNSGINKDYEHLKQENIAMQEQLVFIDEVLGHLQETDDNIYRVIYEVEPVPEYKRNFGTGGNAKKFDRYKGYSHSELIIETREKLEKVQKLLVVQSESYDELKVAIQKKKDLLAATPSIQPISNKDLTRLASGFGMRTHPIYKIQKMHAGMDFTAPTGTDIYATADGVIEKADWMSGYGQTVIIDHGFGYKTLYGHTSQYKCKVGQKVKRGDVIALVGNTGISSGPHCHYEVRKRQKGEGGRMTYKPINPVNFFFNDLSPEEYDQMLELARRPTQSM